MRAVKCALLFVVSVMTCLILGGCAQHYPFQDPAMPVEDRITNIISLMTLDEKIAALGTNPSVPRLGIHASDHVEGLHGLAMGGPGMRAGSNPVSTTTFPQAVGLGETWDPDLVSEAAAAEGQEARYIFQRYHRGALVIRAPNADLDRDPRWGRSEESYGEDPYFNGTLATAFVTGLQGADPQYWQAASLLKHFMANSNEDGRYSSSSNFDETILREYYAVPFQMGITLGGARAFMTAYNAVNGTPMTVQPVLKNIVESEWGFDGIICTDEGALTNLVAAFHYSPSYDEAASAALHAGITEFLDPNSAFSVEGAALKGGVTEQDIDAELRGNFRVMIRLGLLDPPRMVPYTNIGQGLEPWLQSDRWALARKVTLESVVLLKNATNILPLDRTRVHSLAMIGPFADSVLLDWYSGTPPYAISPLIGIQEKLLGSGTSVTFARDNSDNAAVNAAKAADVAIVVVGNHPTCNAPQWMCPSPSDGKEGVDRQSITLDQEALVQQVYAVNPRTVVVLRSSFPFAINWTEQNVPAIVHMAHSSQEEGRALADVLFGDYTPGGRLVDTWPNSLEQLPPMMDYDIRHGRTYMYFTGTPLYPFGYGLSYTKFRYTNLQLSPTSIPANGSTTVSVNITNTGTRTGDEVVQMYVQYPNSQVPRPLKQLRGFRRISLQPGETKTVTLPLSAESLAYYDAASSHFVVEAQPVSVLVGSSSADIHLSDVLTITP